MDSFTSGVVSGLVTSVIILLATQGYAKIVRPWFEELVYRDVRIEGRWNGTFDDIPGYEEVVEIEQAAHRVKGTINIVKGVDAGSLYHFKGTFKNLILTATYSGVSRASLDRGSLAVRLSQNGRCLEGQYAYYQDEKGDICPLACTWKRDAT